MQYKPKLPRYGILIESHSHGPDFSTVLHRHAYPSLIFIASGQGELKLQDRSFVLAANSIILLPADQYHQLVDSPKKPMSIFVLYFRKDILPAIIASKALTLSDPIQLDPYQVHNTRAILREVLFEQSSRQAFHNHVITANLVALLTSLIRNPKPLVKSEQESYVRVRKVLDQIARNYFRSQTISEAAKMASLSQRQFRNMVIRLTGIGYVEFVNKTRIEKASILLKTTSMPVTAIAFEVGFEDLSTFYRQFKKIVGTVPLRYREDQV